MIWRTLRKMMETIGASILVSGFTTCGVKPDNPGTCSLKCGNAVIASGDYTIQKFTDDVNYRCPAGSGTSQIKQETTVKFKIVKKVQLGEGDLAETTVPNVSIEPSVIGLVDTTLGSGSYLGVKTPTSDFCSDSCGVVSLTVVGVCPASQSSEITVGITSGALRTEDPVKITYQSETDEDQSDSGDNSGDNSGDTSSGLLD